MCSAAYMRPLAFFILLLIWNISSLGQSKYDINFSAIDTDNGLPNNSVNGIVKDNLGFVWIGTNNGLCKYESSEKVKVYRKDSPKTIGGIESNIIRSLYFDSKNNLWIGTRLGGLTKFNQAANEWVTYRHDKKNPHSLSNDEVLTITEDSRGLIWVGTEDGLNVFDSEKETFTSFKVNSNDPFSLKSKAVLTICEDNKGWIWVGAWGGGVHLFVPNENGGITGGKFRNFQPNERIGSSKIWSIFQDSKNRYWVGSRGEGVFLMSLSDKVTNQSVNDNWQPSFVNYHFDKSEDKSLSNNHIQALFEDSHNEIWVATVNGLNRIIEKANKKEDSIKPKLLFHTYFYNPNDLTSVTNDNVSSIFEDDQGIFWFGTPSGVSQYNPLTNQFNIHEFIDDISKTPNAQNIFIDNDHIAWVGNGKNGLLKYDLENKQRIDTKNDFDFLLGESINSLYSRDQENLYISTSTSIVVFNMKDNSFKNYPFSEEVISIDGYCLVKAIFKDQKGNVWIGSEDGLFLLNEENGNFKSIAHNPLNVLSISDNAINQIFEDSNGAIWIATFNGLNKLRNIEGDQFYFDRFKHDPEHPDSSIPSNRIVAIEEINGLLYLGSDNGLFGYNLVTETFLNFSENKDSYSIQSIEKTKNGNLWASTTEGIIFFNTELKYFNKYRRQDGLGDVIFHEGSSFCDKNGNLFFGSRRGITEFDPKKIKKNELVPPVFITDIKIMSPDGEKNISGIFQDKITLDYDEYYLSLDYVALNYNRAEKNKYAIKLEGFDKDWTYTSNKLPVVYTNLKYGVYTFKVKAANNDGVWNEVGKSITVIKKPAFWETWWFQLSGFLILSFSLILGMKYYTRHIKRRNKILQQYNEDLNAEIIRRELVEKELQKRESNIKKFNLELQRSNKDLEQFAYIASHDLQEPLRVVGSFISLLRRRYNQYFDKDALDYIGFAVDGVKRMSQQIESILTFSKVGKDAIVPVPTNLNKIIQFKIHDLSEKIKEKNVKIEVTPMPIVYCEPDQIDMVFYNLISNAIKFNKNKNPSIVIAHDAIVSKEFWQFSIKDNGIGIASEYKRKIFEIFKRLHSKQDYEGTGIGLALCEKIIHRHQGEIWLDSKEGEGTTFYFTISKKLNQHKTNLGKSKTEYHSEDVEKITSMN